MQYSGTVSWDNTTIYYCAAVPHRAQSNSYPTFWSRGGAVASLDEGATTAPNVVHICRIWSAASLMWLSKVMGRIREAMRPGKGKDQIHDAHVGGPLERAVHRKLCGLRRNVCASIPIP